MAANALTLSRRISERLMADSDRRVAFRAWDGSSWGPNPAEATVVLEHPGALRALFVPADDLTAGEAYLYGDIDLEGDIMSVMEFAADLASARRSRLDLVRLALDLRRLPQRHDEDDGRTRPSVRGRLHSKPRDRRAIQYHYDTGNEFYGLFLGETMTYSCAYFLSPDDTLDTAQRRKLDVVCRKLALRPGARLLDIGCGWGALAVHAASRYGAEVVGATLSEPQAHHARRLAKEAGVDDRVTILQQDYRDLSGRFDAIASIGMVEHVGRPLLPTYFAKVRSLLDDSGRFLNHGITTNDRSRRYGKRPTFVSTYVFPDGELSPIETTIEVAASAGFEVRDVESLRRSYALTLRRWVANLEAARETAIARSSDHVYRIWRTYMAGSAVAFERAGISVYQTLFAGPRAPWVFGRRGLLAADDG